VFTLGSVVRIRYVLNRNRIYQSRGMRASLTATWVLAGASAVTLSILGVRFQSSLAHVGLGLALGGSASNLFDILRDRHVIDFIDLGWWPVFNVADIAIVVGLVMAILK